MNISWAEIKDVVLTFGCLIVTIYIARSDKRAEIIWQWLRGHGHEIECNKNDCKPKATGVIAPPMK